MRDSRRYGGIRRDKKQQLLQERRFSHGFHGRGRIIWLFSFDTFYVKEKILALKKNLERFWLREIFKKRAVDGLYNNLVHELQIGDREFHFK